MEAAVVGGEHREGAILRQLVMEARFLSKSVKLCQVHLLAGVNQTLNRNHCGGKQGAIDNSRSLTESSYQILKNKLDRVGDSVNGNVYCVSASEVIFKHETVFILRLIRHAWDTVDPGPTSQIYNLSFLSHISVPIWNSYPYIFYKLIQTGNTTK